VQWWPSCRTVLWVRVRRGEGKLSDRIFGFGRNVHNPHKRKTREMQELGVGPNPHVSKAGFGAGSRCFLEFRSAPERHSGGTNEETVGFGRGWRVSEPPHVRPRSPLSFRLVLRGSAFRLPTWAAQSETAPCASDRHPKFADLYFIFAEVYVIMDCR
jgi:hypothetical protein